MAAADEKLTLTVVTPERAVLEGVACDAIGLPGETGELGILPGHAPLVALLGVGRVSYRDGNRTAAIAVRGGFAEVAANQVRVLADLALEKDAVDLATARRLKQEAEGKRLTVAGEAELDLVNADASFAEAQLEVAGSRP